MFASIFNLVPQIIFTILLVILTSQVAYARLGESFQGYKTRLSSISKLQAQTGDNYMFELAVDPQVAASSSGYAAGATITVKDGKISGQSLAIRLGVNTYLASTLAASQIFNFICEAAGKPLPKDKSQLDSDIRPVNQAVTLALM